MYMYMHMYFAREMFTHVAHKSAQVCLISAAPPAPPSPPPPPPTTVTQMVYSSGTTAYSNPSANGTVLLQAGTTYTVQVEILRNDLAGGYDPTRSAAYNEYYLRPVEDYQ